MREYLGGGAAFVGGIGSIVLNLFWMAGALTTAGWILAVLTVPISFLVVPVLAWQDGFIWPGILLGAAVVGAALSGAE